MSRERINFHNPRDRLEIANERLESLSAEDRMQWALNTFDAKKIILTTSGGETSAIIPTLMNKALRSRGDDSLFTIVFVDTLLHGDSTLDFVEKLQERGEQDGYVVRTYKPLRTLEEVSSRYPEWDNFGSPDCEIAKQVLKGEPLQRALGELDADCWASGPMRWETLFRATMPIVDRQKNGLTVFHPIADWSEEKAREYIITNGLLANPIHYDFFKGPDQSLECSIHTSQ